MARNKDKPTPVIEPRCLTREQAAEYCGLSPAGFSTWQKQGLVPGPIPGTNRWDRKALDAALDKASGLSEAQVQPEDAYTAWKRERDAAKAAGAI